MNRLRGSRRMSEDLKSWIEDDDNKVAVAEEAPIAQAGVVKPSPRSRYSTLKKRAPPSHRQELQDRLNDRGLELVGREHHTPRPHGNTTSTAVPGVPVPLQRSRIDVELEEERKNQFLEQCIRADLLWRICQPFGLVDGPTEQSKAAGSSSWQNIPGDSHVHQVFVYTTRFNSHLREGRIAYINMLTRRVMYLDKNQAVLAEKNLLGSNVSCDLVFPTKLHIWYAGDKAPVTHTLYDEAEYHGIPDDPDEDEEETTFDAGPNARNSAALAGGKSSSALPNGRRPRREREFSTKEADLELIKFEEHSPRDNAVNIASLRREFEFPIIEVHRGTLEKRGKTGLSWTHRYIRLVNGHMLIYRTLQSDYPMDSVCLFGMKVKPKGQDIFRLKGKERSFYFRCKDTPERNRWFIAIRLAMERGVHEWKLTLIHLERQRKRQRALVRSRGISSKDSTEWMSLSFRITAPSKLMQDKHSHETLSRGYAKNLDPNVALKLHRENRLPVPDSWLEASADDGDEMGLSPRTARDLESNAGSSAESLVPGQPERNAETVVSAEEKYGEPNEEAEEEAEATLQTPNHRAHLLAQQVQETKPRGRRTKRGVTKGKSSSRRTLKNPKDRRGVSSSTLPTNFKIPVAKRTEHITTAQRYEYVSSRNVPGARSRGPGYSDSDIPTPPPPMYASSPSSPSRTPSPPPSPTLPAGSVRAQTPKASVTLSGSGISEVTRVGRPSLASRAALALDLQLEDDDDSATETGGGPIRIESPFRRAAPSTPGPPSSKPPRGGRHARAASGHGIANDGAWLNTSTEAAVPKNPPSLNDLQVAIRVLAYFQNYDCTSGNRWTDPMRRLLLERQRRHGSFRDTPAPPAEPEDPGESLLPLGGVKPLFKLTSNSVTVQRHRIHEEDGIEEAHHLPARLADAVVRTAVRSQIGLLRDPGVKKKRKKSGKKQARDQTKTTSDPIADRSGESDVKSELPATTVVVAADSKSEAASAAALQGKNLLAAPSRTESMNSARGEDLARNELEHALALQKQARKCFECGKEESEDQHLWRCKGCRKVLYCGKECQTRSWKTIHWKACATMMADDSLREMRNSVLLMQSPLHSSDTYNTLFPQSNQRGTADSNDRPEDKALENEASCSPSKQAVEPSGERDKDHGEVTGDFTGDAEDLPGDEKEVDLGAIWAELSAQRSAAVTNRDESGQNASDAVLTPAEDNPRSPAVNSIEYS